MQGSEGQSGLDKDGLLSSDLSFVVTAAHELKSPLTLVRQLGLSLESGAISSPDEQAKMLRQIILTSERALRLTTDLSRSSRLNDSLFELEPLNPQQICEEVAHELAPLFRARGREIRVASRHRPLLAVANRDLLRRVILNFGDNALHYAGDTPVELRAGSLDGGRTVRIGVRDYGPAVPADMWRRVQSQLGSGAQPLHARPQSSGLGLLVAGQFAGAMNGQIGASRHRDGATFYIDINASTQLSLL
jgi:signal transduction histidine kinase